MMSENLIKWLNYSLMTIPKGMVGKYDGTSFFFFEQKSLLSNASECAPSGTVRPKRKYD